MRKFLDMLFNAVFILAAVALTLLLALGFTLKSFGATPKPAIYYPNAPEVTVMEIDTGVDFNIDNLAVHIPEKYQSVEYMDNHGHGTHIAGIILKDTCLNVKLIPCKFSDGPGDPAGGSIKEVECLQKALEDKVDIVNFSAGGQFPKKEELDILKKMEKEKIVVVVAAGNNMKGGHELTLSDDVKTVNEYLENCNDLTNCEKQKFYYYPASYTLTNIVKVSNYHKGEKLDYSNYGLGFIKADGEDIESYTLGGSIRQMSGTSQATASVTNTILKEMCSLFK